MNNYKDIKLDFGKSVSALDLLDRADFKSDAAYIHACAQLDMQRHSKEYMEAEQRIVFAISDRQAQERRAEEQAAMDALMQNVTLDDYEQKKAHTAAVNRTSAALNEGKIESSAFDDTLRTYEQEESQRALRDKTMRLYFNEQLRNGKSSINL